MSRRYAPIYTSIWRDEAFTALPADAQRLYLLALSQPNITYCGVVPYTSKRWAQYATDTSPRSIGRAVAMLSGFVLLDETTEELWVRSFIKHNKVLEQPKLKLAAKRQFGEVVSPPIRSAITAAYPGVFDSPGDTQPDTPSVGQGLSVLDIINTEHLTPSPLGGDVVDPARERERVDSEVESLVRTVAERESFRFPDIGNRPAWIAKRCQTLLAQVSEASNPLAAAREMAGVREVLVYEAEEFDRELAAKSLEQLRKIRGKEA